MRRRGTSSLSALRWRSTWPVEQALLRAFVRIALEFLQPGIKICLNLSTTVLQQIFGLLCSHKVVDIGFSKGAYRAVCSLADARYSGYDIPELVEGRLVGLLKWSGAPHVVLEECVLLLAESMCDLGS